MNLRQLIESGEHQTIAELTDPRLYRFKVIALIHLGNYSEALKYTEKGSYERAYIYYKMKQYKKAIKLLAGKQDNASQMLLSQCLYFLGYYNSAYEILAEFKKDDEIVVNLQAMKSMAILAEKTSLELGYPFSVKQKDSSAIKEDLTQYKFQAAEGRIDFLYNLSFEHLNEFSKFEDFLDKLVQSHPQLKKTILEEQLFNIRGEFDCINVDILSKSQKETLKFNLKEIPALSHPQHFQKYTEYLLPSDSLKSANDYCWIKKAFDNNFNMDYRQIPLTSDKLKLLSSLVALKTKNISAERITARLKNVADCTLKRVLLQLATLSPQDAESRAQLRATIAELQ